MLVSPSGQLMPAMNQYCNCTADCKFCGYCCRYGHAAYCRAISGQLVLPFKVITTDRTGA